jgi:DNA-binding NarL/FixJ family response regulator
MKNTVSPPRERILIVEDEPSILLAVTDYLAHLGYEVDAASEMQAAERLLGEKQYAAVISDLRLTGTGANEGLELAEIVRQQFPATEMILLSAYGSHNIEEQARAHGVTTFLHKPKPLAELAQILYSVLSEKEVPPVVSIPLGGVRPDAERRPRAGEPALERFQLTADELQVARLVSAGRGNAEIARELAMPEAEVRTHRDALASRLDPRSRFELALYLVREVENR